MVTRLSFLRIAITQNTHPTLWTHESSHVFNHPNYRYFDFTTKIDLLPHILQCDFLRRCDNNSTSNASFFQILYNREMFIGSTWWRVNQEVIKVPPIDVFDKLFY